MKPFRFAPYFENEVLRKRPYLSKELVILVVKEPLRTEVQPNGRVRFWAQVMELGGRYLRVVTLEDRETILNAFLDRDFKP